jgi:hypothetical protein
MSRKTIENHGSSFTVFYDSSQRGSMQRHLSYTAALSKKNNPLWNRLVDKADHLAAAAEIAPFGIIACDGGCSLFHRTAAFGQYTAGDIVQQLLREKPFVSFVLLLRSIDIVPFARYKRTFRIDPVFYSSRQDSDISQLRATLIDAVARLPKPVLDPLNAYIQSREDNYRAGRLGVYHLTGNSVKISARTILELLVGRRTPSEIHESFERLLQQGRMITGIRVEKSGYRQQAGVIGWVFSVIYARSRNCVRPN